MKLAVLDIHGPQSTLQLKRRYYYKVENDYDFSGNSATDVTTWDNVNTAYMSLLFTYVEYKDWLTDFASQNVFSSLTIDQQVILCKNFVASDEEIDSIYTPEQKDSLRLSYLDVVENSRSNFTTYRIMEDIDFGVDKDFKSINYKTELASGKSYTPIYTIHPSGSTAGLIDKTDYYRGFVDEDNKGELVLVVDESYELDGTDTDYPFTSIPVTARTKTWKWVSTDGFIDDINTKQKRKLYNTRKKRHKEGIRRRDNIVEQLIDNIGLAGVLSGTFIDESDAHTHLISLEEKHNSALNSWLSSGRGSLYNDISGDTTTTWLSATTVDNENTQSMVPWMIGLSNKDYIIDKLKGNIK